MIEVNYNHITYNSYHIKPEHNKGEIERMLDIFLLILRTGDIIDNYESRLQPLQSTVRPCTNFSGG